MEKIAHAKRIDICYETFGQKKDPALLLIMGALCQGIMWPNEFCKMLAEQGLYVIRYDHRDAGLSTCGDFKQHPYDLLDLAKDALALLDELGIRRAHVCGLSMGGPIAELMSLHAPDRILTVTLIATSSDFRPSSLAYDGVFIDAKLSSPKEVYVNWMHAYFRSPPQTDEENLKQRVLCWSILSGTKAPFEEAYYQKLHRKFISRIRHPESIPNHLLAIKKSFQMIQDAPKQMNVPTLIVHGTEDPIFPEDHGEALAKEIQGSRYVLIDGFGHVLHSKFYPLIVREMTKLIKNHDHD